LRWAVTIISPELISASSALCAKAGAANETAAKNDIPVSSAWRSAIDWFLFILDTPLAALTVAVIARLNSTLTLTD
jgi:hypothetical protein